MSTFSREEQRGNAGAFWAGSVGLFFSYSTLVGLRAPNGLSCRTATYYSRTTAKHITQMGLSDLPEVSDEIMVRRALAALALEGDGMPEIVAAGMRQAVASARVDKEGRLQETTAEGFEEGESVDIIYERIDRIHRPEEATEDDLPRGPVVTDPPPDLTGLDGHGGV